MLLYVGINHSLNLWRQFLVLARFTEQIVIIYVNVVIIEITDNWYSGNRLRWLDINSIHTNARLFCKLFSLFVCLFVLLMLQDSAHQLMIFGHSSEHLVLHLGFILVKLVLLKEFSGVAKSKHFEERICIWPTFFVGDCTLSPDRHNTVLLSRFHFRQARPLNDVNILFTAQI
ncbi:hypothetical protein D3C86_1737600 [compost metagenome]